MYDFTFTPEHYEIQVSSFVLNNHTMLAKIILVVFLMTSAVSLAKEDHENEIASTLMTSTSNILKEISKLAGDDQGKFYVDLNALYKKYEIAAKADQFKSYVYNQAKKGFEVTNDLIKKSDLQSEDNLKKSIDIIKKEDPVLGEKLTKFYDKSCDLDRITEDIIKYVLDADKISSVYEKARASIRPMEHKLAESVRKFESILLEHLPKKGNK